MIRLVVPLAVALSVGLTVMQASPAAAARRANDALPVAAALVAADMPIATLRVAPPLPMPTPAPAPAPIADEKPGSPRSGPPSHAEVQTAITRGLVYLLSIQEPDGSFGAPRNVMFNEDFATYYTYKAWTYATTGLCAMTLADCGASDDDRKALDRAIDYLLANSDLRRISEWDVDNVWGFVYGTQAVGHLLRSPKLGSDPRRAKLVELGNSLLEKLARWQTPIGGWAYYDTDATTIPPVWTTSFTTAACVIGMLEAKQAGLKVDEKVLAKAIGAVQHSRLPNGAYDYNLDTICDPRGLENINQVKGSLGRIQVGNVALFLSGELDAKTVNWGLEQFFEHHKFLAVGREKPIPHEAYYNVAAYFFLFGHFYASEAIELLPVDARPKFATQLQQKLLEIQEKEGSYWDFHVSDYTRAYGTAFATMALQRTLDATTASAANSR